MADPAQPDDRHRTDVAPAGDPVDDAPPAEPPAAAAIRRRSPRWIDLVAVLLLAILAVAAVLPQVARHAPFSALDEATHFDYAFNASQLQIPAAGDHLDPEVIEYWNCYGNELAFLPACGATGEPEEYPLSALQYNFGHPPVYYFVTGIAARALDALTGLDLLEAARAMGAVWLAAGMAVMHLALRRLGVGVVLAASVAALSGMWWAVLGASAIVTNDAPFLLTTALGVLGVAELVRGRHRPWAIALLIAGAALAAGVKVMNGLPYLGLAGAMVVLALLPQRWRPWAGRWSLIGIAAGMVAAVGGVYLLWTRFQGGRGDQDWQNPVSGVNTSDFVGSPFGEWLPTLTRGLDYVGHSYVTDGAALQPLIQLLAGVVSAVALAAIAIGIAVGRRGSALAVLAMAALIATAAWPLVVQLQSFLSSGGTEYFAQPSRRYGATVGVLAFAALALIAERLRWRAVVVAGCVLVVVGTLVAVLVGELPAP